MEECELMEEEEEEEARLEGREAAGVALPPPLPGGTLAGEEEGVVLWESGVQLKALQHDKAAFGPRPWLTEARPGTMLSTRPHSRESV